MPKITKVVWEFNSWEIEEIQHGLYWLEASDNYTREELYNLRDLLNEILDEVSYPVEKSEPAEGTRVRPEDVQIAPPPQRNFAFGDAETQAAMGM